MVSFGFKRSCPLVEITQRRLPRAPVPIEVGRHYEIDGALFRKRWGTLTTEGRKVPHFPSKPRPTCVVMPPHFPSESVPHFARNPHTACGSPFRDSKRTTRTGSRSARRKRWLCTTFGSQSVMRTLRLRSKTKWRTSPPTAPIVPSLSTLSKSRTRPFAAGIGWGCYKPCRE